MPRSAGQKLKILYLLKILEEESDAQHPLSALELAAKLKQYDITAERKSIYNDISHLQEFGIDIIWQKERPTGYYLASRDFELAELKLLVDAVQSSKFITSKKSRELIKKLEGLCSREEAKQLQRQVVVSNRIKTMNESIYYNVDKIHEAIQANAQITFEYYEWSVAKELVARKDGAAYVISPWALNWDDSNYYLIGYDGAAQMVKYYRVDKMMKIVLTDQRREGEESLKDLDLPGLSKRTFGMFGGTETTVRLRFENRMIGVVLDRFGTKTAIRPDGDAHFVVRVDVAVSSPFYGWIFGLGDSVRILSPDHVAEEYRSQLQDILKHNLDEE